MKLIKVAIMILLIQFFLAFFVHSQDTPTMNKSEVPANELETSNKAQPVRSYREFLMGCSVLIFGIVTLLLEYMLIKNRDFKSDEILRLFTTTFIIISTLFLITVGYTTTIISPVIGLYGTVIGYLLGKGDSKS
jgi:uncharacterized membrane protein